VKRFLIAIIAPLIAVRDNVLSGFVSSGIFRILCGLLRSVFRAFVFLTVKVPIWIKGNFTWEHAHPKPW